MIGILLKPFEDELISSWFTRLSIQNGIDDVRCFIQSYVSPHKMLKSISNTSSCTNLYLLYFCKVSGMSPYELFVNQTEYPAVAPLSYGLSSNSNPVKRFWKPNRGYNQSLHKRNSHMRRMSKRRAIHPNITQSSGRKGVLEA